MKIVFVSPELAPFAKVGGLADVASSLPRALQRLGHEVVVIAPRYGSIDGDRYRLRPSSVAVAVPMDGALRRATLAKVRVNGVTTYLVESPEYFDGRGVYGDNGADYADNAFRFAFFARAALAVSRALELEPDIYHLNDWQTALLPIYQGEEAFPPVATVLTVHNLAYQGIFPSDWLHRLDLPRELFHIDGLEFYGQLSFLKGGLVTADRLTTVSPSYAREIQTEELGAGLEGVVRSRADRLSGILNGIEPRDWHPAKDEALVASYASTRLAGKLRGKHALQQELGLRTSARTPLLAAIGRLDPQKGFDVLLEAAPALLSSGRAQLVVLGSGNEELLDAFRRLEARFPEAVSVNRGFQDVLGRRIYAGADLFLMPSRYEPCGLGQMIALRYGTLPVVRAIGGLADTIRDLDVDPDGGNGFSFDEYSAAALTAAVHRALRHYVDEKKWVRWVRRAMRQDFTWKRSAAEYVHVYEKALT